MAHIRAQKAASAGLALLVWIVTSCSGAGEGQLRYKPDQPGGPAMPTIVHAQADPKAKPAGEPKYVSSNPRRFQVKLGPKRADYTFILDESQGTGKGYDRLYVDTNGNGDLRDDAPTKGEASKDGDFSSAQFPAAEVLIDYDGRKLPWRFAARCFSFPILGEGTLAQLMLSAEGHLEAATTVAGKRVKIALVDANSNGSFNDGLGAPATQGPGESDFGASSDRLVLDLNGDGRFEAGSSDSPDAVCSGRYLIVGGQCHEVKVDASGRGVSITPSTVPLGSLAREGGGAFRVTLGSPSAGRLTVRSTGQPAKVPVGDYTISSCAVERKDKAGAVWTAIGRSVPAAQRVKISEGEVTTATFGPPLKAAITGPKPRLFGLLGGGVKRGSRLVLRLQITGQAGESYRADEITRAGQQPPKVKVKVLDEAGKTIAEGAFEYG